MSKVATPVRRVRWWLVLVLSMACGMGSHWAAASGLGLLRDAFWRRSMQQNQILLFGPFEFRGPESVHRAEANHEEVLLKFVDALRRDRAVSFLCKRQVNAFRLR